MPKNEALPRNSACLNCRRRKLRCNAEKPICGTCLKSNLTNCTYQQSLNSNTNASSKRVGKVNRLEERIADLEKELNFMKVGNNSTTNGSNNFFSLPQVNIEPQLSVGHLNWPKEFPPFDLALHLVQTFFNNVPYSSFLHRSTFESSLFLPPSHKHFPASSILHSIFAVAARHSPHVTKPTGLPNLEPRNNYDISLVYIPKGQGESFMEVHCRIAQELIDSNALRSPDIDGKIEVMKASIILANFMHAEFRLPDFYNYVTLAIRGCISFNLHVNIRRFFISEPSCDLEREKRKRQFYYAYILDNLYCMSTSTWPNNLPEDEVFATLPCSTDIFITSDSQSEIPDNQQSIQSLDFFDQRDSDSLILVLKATILLSRVNRHISRTVLTKEKDENFKKLDMKLYQFRSTIPTDIVTFTESGFDTENYLAHLIALKANMELHYNYMNEPTSRKKCLNWARVVISSIYRLMGTSFDFGRLSSFTLLAWDITAEILKIDYLKAIKNNNPNHQYIRSELETLAEAYRCMSASVPIAILSLRRLDQMMSLHGLDSFGKLDSVTRNPIMNPVVDPSYVESIINDTHTMTLPNVISSGTAFTSADEFRYHEIHGEEFGYNDSLEDDALSIALASFTHNQDLDFDSNHFSFV